MLQHTQNSGRIYIEQTQTEWCEWKGERCWTVGGCHSGATAIAHSAKRRTEVAQELFKRKEE